MGRVSISKLPSLGRSTKHENQLSICISALGDDHRRVTYGVALPPGRGCIGVGLRFLLLPVLVLVGAVMLRNAWARSERWGLEYGFHDRGVFFSPVIVIGQATVASNWTSHTRPFFGHAGHGLNGGHDCPGGAGRVTESTSATGHGASSNPSNRRTPRS